MFAAEPARKRPRTSTASAAGPSSTSAAEAPTKTKRARVKGKLALMTNLPLDCIYEILAYLHPLDLLHMSCLCRPLRSVLTSRTAKPVWSASLASLTPAPPACPENMNEIQYSRLLFDAHCSFCYGIAVQTVPWDLYCRACKKCLQDESIFKMRDYMFNERDEMVWAKAIPCASFDHAVLGGEVDLFLASQVDAAVVFFNEQIGAGVPKDEVLNRMSTEVEKTHQHAEACSMWASNANLDKAHQREDKRSRRRKAIEEHLTELGWGGELEAMRSHWSSGHRFTNSPHVKKAQDLTARMWANMRNDMVALMEDFKSDRLKRERTRACELRVARLREWREDVIVEDKHDNVFPPLVDLYHHFAEVRNAIDAPSGPEDHKRYRESREMRQLLCRFDFLCARWRRHVAQRIIRCIPETKDGPVRDESELHAVKEVDKDGDTCLLPSIEGTSPVDLATALFSTSCCPGQVFDFENLLTHGCMYKYAEFDPTTLERRPHRYFHMKPWNYQGHVTISFHAKASQIARKLVESWGLDPDTATAGEMDECEKRVFCKRCIHHGRGSVLDWRHALEHILETKHADMEEADPDVAEMADEDERETRLEYCSLLARWDCAYCGLEHLTTQDLQRHLAGKHEVYADEALCWEDFHPSHRVFAGGPGPIHREVELTEEEEDDLDYESESSKLLLLLATRMLARW